MQDTTTSAPSPAPLTKKDFKSDQEVRWCPGCGDYAILNMVQTVMAGLGIARHDIVFVSGIGCSSRFPYYMNTYGFHTIHGRAPAFATGIKSANPKLSVWLATGDGDGLSIGGNHLAHILRRNVDIKILLFNNQVYGLTKGQYSPTSPVGQKTKSSPLGAIDRPFNPLAFALGCNATFVARTIDTHQKHMQSILEAAAQHKGTAFVEIYQNCNIFNDGAFDEIVNRDVRDDRTVDLKPGKPLVYGKNLEKGIKIDAMETKIVSAAEATTWNAATKSGAPAYVLAEMDLEKPAKPVPIGIFRAIEAPSYDEEINRQVATSVAKRGPGKLRDLIFSGDMWEVR
ncbi:MAG TPA: 2-oxoacid:ferredoxin oxidoreductase subunit beta [Planctomycetota bacterium]|jgi:2-oxoglutarate ferredoxin oxidoreductase subunit beta|nr:2-oxoacid:ferredoxin oxidoreductase subunit beta [Planctomycetota bacterium]